MLVQGIDQTVLANKAGMSQGQISYWRNGRQTSIGSEQMQALQAALSSDPLDHAALIRAHLRDENFGLATELVRVEVDTPAEVKDRPRPKTKGEKALHFLGEQRMISRDVNDLVIDLARCLGADI